MKKIQNLGKSLTRQEQKLINGGDPPLCRVICEQTGGMGTFSIYFDGIGCTNTPEQQAAEAECLSYSGATIHGCIC